ncbi:hypothetical protein [uncultured Adlercreutzia sp.]|uniref:hypothetical protein n=1 Tax=uncultured Adlercreutzia sp. TaxID=875803 RepID=UPI0025DBC89D|nr:hypothetical protein [uncultured Adlercreutzia sp.]
MAGEDTAPETAPEAAPEVEPETAPQTEPEAAEPEQPEGADGDAEDPEGPEADATDWKARSRMWESRAKSNKAKADEKDAEIASLRAQIERGGEVARVAREKGVSAELLARMAGDTAEEIEANADALAEWARSAQGFPETPDEGGGRPAPMTREQILAERNPVRRAQLMGEHRELFTSK